MPHSSNISLNSLKDIHMLLLDLAFVLCLAVCLKKSLKNGSRYSMNLMSFYSKLCHNFYSKSDHPSNITQSQTPLAINLSDLLDSSSLGLDEPWLPLRIFKTFQLLISKIFPCIEIVPFLFQLYSIVLHPLYLSN